MIITSNDRGMADHGWLKSRHTFSFADYYNQQRMGYSVLRVINEDQIEGGTGFGTHPHRDMEIISYVVEGALEHKDSMGTETIIKPGELQRMSAGTGIRHSEYNHSKDKKTHFLQIWILPEKTGISPSYAQKDFSAELATNELTLVISKEGRNGSITIHQDIDLYALKSSKAAKRTFLPRPQRKIWLQNINGKVQAGEISLNPGDGLAIEKPEALELAWNNGSEFLIFDLPL